MKNKDQKHKIEVYWKKKQLFLFEPKTFFVLVGVSCIVLLFYFFGGDASRYLSSVISPIPEHAPYNGLTLPVKEAPDWVHLTETERKSVYSAIPKEKILPLPSYVPERLSVPVETLKWGDLEHNKIRNEKITYAVPYLGNYQLNGLENVGSHPAVDIKMPEGTPVYSIGNGTVVKAQIGSGGFGNNIVVMHRDFPSFDDPSKPTTVYSGYAHLSQIIVKENDVVVKGQQIGFSGNTGASTAPHLHFQIDNDSPAWHLYWPFNSADMQAAGLSFFEAINAGLNKDKGALNTINSMKYVQKHAATPQITEPVILPAPAPEPTPVTVTPPVVSPSGDEPTAPQLISYTLADKNRLPFPRFEIRVPSFMYNNESAEVLVQYFDTETNNVAPPAESQRYFLQVVMGQANFDFPVLQSSDFVNGIAKIRVTPLSSPELGFTVAGAGTLGSTDIIPIRERGQTVEIPADQIFSDVPAGSEYESALRFLKNAGVIAGYPDGTFKPGKTVYRVEALKMIFVALKAQVDVNAIPVFPDLEAAAWYLPYVLKAFNDNVVAGYPDGFFRPTAEVNIVEFYKMLFLAAKTDIDPQVLITLPTGVSAQDWFAPYVQEAVKKNILEVKGDPFNPGYAMTRGDIAIALYKLLNVQ